MPVKVTWQQTLAWRMRRHGLDPVGALPVEDVVGRLCGVQAQVASSAELAVGVRRDASRPGEVARALADGRLIKTWAMRGTLHLLTPGEGAAFLSVIAAGRSWERPSWQRYFGMTPPMMEALREATREALNGRALTREELIAELLARPGLRHAADGLRSGWGTLLKPLAWQGDLCFGPNVGNRVSFMRPEAASAGWAGIPELEEAAPSAVLAYVRAHGPTTPVAFGRWLAGGWFGTRQLAKWFAAVSDRLVEVEVDGERLCLLAEDVDELASMSSTATVRLLPGFDQYVLGPGTADAHVVPPGRRNAVSKQSGWISPVVVAGGRVGGTWELDGQDLRVAWFGEAGPVPTVDLQDEVARVSSILGRALRLSVVIA